MSLLLSGVSGQADQLVGLHSEPGSTWGSVATLELLMLDADDRMVGLELDDLAVAGCSTKAPCGGDAAGGSPVDGGNQGRKRSPITKARGHFALTGLLFEQMLPLPGSRVVTVSSLVHRLGARINFDDLQGERSYRWVAAYGQSKLANLLFTYELQRRLSDAGAGTTIAVAAHPGLAGTELTRNTPAITAFFYARVFSQQAAMGALPILRAATDPDVLGGQYYGPGGPFGARGYPTLANSSPQSHNTAIQRRLWTVSEELTRVTFPV